HSCPLYSDVLDNRHKMQLYIEHRRTTQKVSKISDQRYEDTGKTECIPMHDSNATSPSTSQEY
ncbi:unnamed protein product, partial [Ascophyllum nodosum]